MRMLIAAVVVLAGCGAMPVEQDGGGDAAITTDASDAAPLSGAYSCSTCGGLTPLRVTVSDPQPSISGQSVTIDFMGTLAEGFVSLCEVNAAVTPNGALFTGGTTCGQPMVVIQRVEFVNVPHASEPVPYIRINATDYRL